MNTAALSKFAIGAIVLTVIIGGVFFAQGTREGGKADNDIARLSSINLTDLSGTPLSLSSYSGKPLVINAWAVWCPFCRKELADFAALQKEFPDIAVVAIDRAESADVVAAYLTEIGVQDRMTFLLDPEDAFYKAIGGFSMPETILIDGNGSIVFHKRGPLTLEEMKSLVRKHLQQ